MPQAPSYSWLGLQMLGASVCAPVSYPSSTDDWTKFPLSSFKRSHSYLRLILLEKSLHSLLSKSLAPLRSCQSSPLVRPLDSPLLLPCCLCYFLDPSSSFSGYFIVLLSGFTRDIWRFRNFLFHLHAKLGIRFAGWKLFSFRILKVSLYGLQASNTAAKSNDVLILGPFPLS